MAPGRGGVDHLAVFWEAHGHPPGPFLTPHFDFHFYVISDSATDAIDCSNTTKPQAIPASYTLPDVDIPKLGMLTGLCVPKMGMHALPEEFATGTTPFTGTMVFGYYAQRPIFYEPMLSRAMLQERRSIHLAGSSRKAICRRVSDIRPSSRRCTTRPRRPTALRLQRLLPIGIGLTLEGRCS